MLIKEMKHELKKLEKELNYINTDSMVKLYKNVYNNIYSDDFYLDLEKLDMIYVLMEKLNYNISFANNEEQRDALIETMDVCIDNITQHCIQNTLNLSNSLGKIDENYKKIMDDSSVSLKKDLIEDDIYSVMSEINKMYAYSKNEDEVMQMAKEENLELFVSYYSLHSQLMEQENAIKLLEAYSNCNLDDDFNFNGMAFLNEDAFQLSTYKYLDYYWELKNFIKEIQLTGVDDKKFDEVVEFLGIDVENLVNYINKSYEKPNLIQARIDANKTILDFAGDVASKTAEFWSDYAMLLPRALFSKTGKFVASRYELENILNKSAFENLDDDYFTFLEFLKDNNVKISIPYEQKDKFLNKNKFLQTKEELIQDVCECKNGFENVELSYDNISKEYLNKIEPQKELEKNK